MGMGRRVSFPISLTQNMDKTAIFWCHLSSCSHSWCFPFFILKRDPGIVSFHLGALNHIPNSDIPPQSCLRAFRLEISGGKSKKQGAVDVPWLGRRYGVIVEYFLGSETFLPKTGGPLLSHNHKLRVCLLNYSKRLKNVASNLHYTMQMIKCQTKWSCKRTT